MKFLAPAVLWFNSVIPLGVFMGAGVRMQKPSAGIIAKFSVGFFPYSLIPLALLNEFVVFPILPFVKRDVETRWRWFGLLLLLSGIAVQLIAALLAIGGQ